MEKLTVRHLLLHQPCFDYYYIVSTIKLGYYEICGIVGMCTLRVIPLNFYAIKLSFGTEK